jgi:hypothetical protein
MISPTKAVVGYIPQATQYDIPLQYTQLEDGIYFKGLYIFLLLFPSVLASNIASLSCEPCFGLPK